MKYLLIIFLFVVSCTPQITNKEIFIRDTTYIIKPKEVRFTDTITKVDSSFVEYLRKNHNDTDTLIYVKFYPVEKKIQGVFKPDTIRITARDTLIKNETIEKIIETPFWSKVGIYMSGLVTFAILILVYYLFKVKIIDLLKEKIL